MARNLCWIACFFVVVGLPASTLADDAPFDAARLKTGRFTYVDIQNDQEGSPSTCTIHRLKDGRYRFTCDFPSFQQSWSTVATQYMAPVKTVLNMRTKDGGLYKMDLSYSGRHATSVVAISGGANGNEGKPTNSLVEADIPARTVDQRIDWATAMATALQPGQQFRFNVYDAKTATSRVTCSISDAGTMHTPLGDFRAIRLDYKVGKASRAEEYTVYATRNLPRMMLREDLPGGLTWKLIRVDR
jgi:Protein of unknown function (DUF3108)